MLINNSKPVTDQTCVTDRWVCWEVKIIGGTMPVEITWRNPRTEERCYELLPAGYHDASYEGFDVCPEHCIKCRVRKLAEKLLGFCPMPLDLADLVGLSLTDVSLGNPNWAELYRFTSPDTKLSR
jgi:hypothetical protein